jgi:hypothetical protein
MVPCISIGSGKGFTWTKRGIPTSTAHSALLAHTDGHVSACLDVVLANWPVLNITGKLLFVELALIMFYLRGFPILSLIFSLSGIFIFVVNDEVWLLGGTWIHEIYENPNVP